MNQDQLVVVVPVFNESATLAALFDEWRAVFETLRIHDQWIFVDDGSTDSTEEVLADLSVRAAGSVRVIAQPNSGHGAACRRGYTEAVGTAAGWVLQIDSDGQCDPGHFGDFWRARASHDCIFGRRTSRDDGPDRRFISAVCAAVVSSIAGLSVGDVNVPYRLMRRDALAAALESVPPGFQLQNVALTVALLRLPGLRWAWLPIHFRRRAGGANSLNFARIVRLGWELLRQRKGLRA